MGKPKVALRLLTVLGLLALAPPAGAGAFAQSRARSAARRPQEAGRAPYTQHTPQVWCKDNRRLNLTGEYMGVYFLDKGDEQGTPATFRVDGNSFSLRSDSLKGEGVITAVNSCGDTSVALRFERASGVGDSRIQELLSSVISMDARRVGAPASEMSNLRNLNAEEPIVMATSFDRQGRLAGPDFAFVICPPHPACKRYPKCPCPEPK